MILKFAIHLARLGRSKLCAVYWVLGNLPPGSNSRLTSIYLALLCKSDDLKVYGYDKVFEPLLQELKTLEQHSVFLSQLGQFVKGSVQCVIYDNLGAHGIGGFVESFSAGFVQETNQNFRLKVSSRVLFNFEPEMSMMLMSSQLHLPWCQKTVCYNQAPFTFSC